MHQAPDMGRLTLHNTRLVASPRGVWEIKWTGRDSRGQSHGYAASTFTTDEDEAKAYRVQWLKARNEAVQALTTPTVAEIIERYADHCEKRGANRSQKELVWRVRKTLGAYPPQDLVGDPLDDFVYQRRSAGVCDATIRRELGALTAALNWAAHPQKGRMIAKAMVPQILLPEAIYEERRFLDEDAEAEFIGLALGWHYKPVRHDVMIGLNTGARKEAIEDLDWSRIDLKARVIDFRLPGIRPKRNKKRVAAHINDRLLDYLESIPAMERSGRLLPGNIYHGFRNFARTTPYAWVTSHIMRHTYITLELRAGTSIWDVAKQVGDTVTVIEAHYGHWQADSRTHTALNKRFRK